uniref:Uncharacterized protein n=1 Tax=Sinocyclocheilus anshuiensis TaxID=1608454 RepID=A0A671R511_9TELE
PEELTDLTEKSHFVTAMSQLNRESQTYNPSVDLKPVVDINGLYPSEVWNDDVTPLTAAVLCRNEEICSYLLEKSADPNKPSTNGRTPLHYAAFTTGVQLSIVERLLTGKANPNGYQLQIFTPLQCAVDQDREDIVKALIEAGASPIINHGVNPELDKKVKRMIRQLSSHGDHR